MVEYEKWEVRDGKLEKEMGSEKPKKISPQYPASHSIFTLPKHERAF